MRRVLAAASICLAAGASSAFVARAGEKELAVRPGVAAEGLPGARRIDATLPGRLISYALVAKPDGGSWIYFLLDPQTREKPGAKKTELAGKNPCPPETTAERERPRLLYGLDPSGDGRLESVREDLPSDTHALESADVDADGREDLILARPGELSFLRPGEEKASPRMLIQDAELDVRQRDPHVVSLPAGERGLWPVSVLGSERFYGRAEEGKWGLAGFADLPVHVSRHEDSLTIRSPAVRAVGRDAMGRSRFVAGPVAVGDRRLRTLLLDPLAAGADRVSEIWSRLPGPEMVLESFPCLLDGKPALVVTTRSAEKLSFFKEKFLRVFALEGGDRSRAGSPPVFEVESNANLWQQVLPVVRDVDGDGRDDLVVAYYRGIRHDRIVLDAYTRDEAGGFRKSPGSTQFELEHADRSAVAYGPDLNGDGTADLMLQADGRLLIYAGSPAARRGKKLVAETPEWSLPAEREHWQAAGARFEIGLSSSGLFVANLSAIGAPRVADVNGDGREEILTSASLEKSWTRFGVIFLER